METINRAIGQRSFTEGDLAEIKKSFETEGFVVVDGLLPTSLLLSLQEAASNVTKRTRDGGWPHKRTVGKQFPPWNDVNPDVWGVQHVMHPDLEEPTFGEFYGSEGMLRVVQGLMGCKEQEVMMGLFNLLVEPKEHDFALSWHRDFIKSSVDEETERRELGIEHSGIQWNAALYDDDCLLAVPRSHRRVRTPEERHATSSADGSLPMPGSETLHLNAGQTIFYDAQILHRGTYNSKVKRATLHGLHQDVREPPSRGGGVLQHGTEWLASQSSETP